MLYFVVPAKTGGILYRLRIIEDAKMEIYREFVWLLPSFLKCDVAPNGFPFFAYQLLPYERMGMHFRQVELTYFIVCSFYFFPRDVRPNTINNETDRISPKLSLVIHRICRSFHLAGSQSFRKGRVQKGRGQDRAHSVGSWTLTLTP